MRPLLLLLFGASILPAQPISFGVKGGVPLTDFINTVSNSSFNTLSTTQRYIVGPMVELQLPWGFSIEGDALFRQFNYHALPTLPDIGSFGASTNDWEFPIVLKYRFASHLFVRPYVGLGASFDTLQGVTNLGTLGNIAGSEPSTPGELKNSTTTGAVLEGGLDMHLLFLHIMPEVRYTRWTSQHFTLPNILNSNQNQAEFLVGITF
ncbi:MAG TPA: outer membrane beta-barrel protein [Verrucomicrobiae bacterium]|nr:outer membrane beta-barrel protein [Verrucomicrobiae bacterium]